MFKNVVPCFTFSGSATLLLVLVLSFTLTANGEAQVVPHQPVARTLFEALPVPAFVQTLLSTTSWAFLIMVAEHAMALSILVTVRELGRIGGAPPGPIELACEEGAPLVGFALLSVVRPYARQRDEACCAGARESRGDCHAPKSSAPLFGMSRAQINGLVFASGVAVAVNVLLGHCGWQWPILEHVASQPSPAFTVLIRYVTIVVRTTTTALMAMDPGMQKFFVPGPLRKAPLDVDEDSAGMCVCCFQREAVQVFSKCGHLVYCVQCGDAMARVSDGDDHQSVRRMRCPLCRQESEMVALRGFEGFVYRQ